MKNAAILLLLPVVAHCATLEEFKRLYNSHRDHQIVKRQRQGRLSSASFEGHEVENIEYLFPEVPENVNSPITCNMNEHNYCNYPDIIPIETVEMSQLMQFPIPSGRCPEGYEQMPTYDCMNWAPALFETTCCVFIQTDENPETERDLCDAQSEVRPRAFAKLCNNRVLAVVEINGVQRVFRLDSHLQLMNTTSASLSVITSGIITDEEFEVLGAITREDCTIDWFVSPRDAPDDIQVVSVDYMDDIVPSAPFSIDSNDPNNVYQDLFKSSGGSNGGIPESQGYGSFGTDGAVDSSSRIIKAAWSLSSNGFTFPIVSFIAYDENDEAHVDARIMDWQTKEDGQLWTTYVPIENADNELFRTVLATAEAEAGPSVEAAYYDDEKDRIWLATCEDSAASCLLHLFTRNGRVLKDPVNFRDYVCDQVQQAEASENGDDGQKVVLYVPIPVQQPVGLQVPQQPQYGQPQPSYN